jgi:PQQ-like domain
MAHPAATGRPARQDAMYQPQPASPGGSHHLLAADLKTGRHIWEQQISGDVITAPVISDGVVYFTTFDGTSYSLNATDGSVIWIKANAATSAPVVAGGYLYETRKEQDGKERRVSAWRAWTQSYAPLGTKACLRQVTPITSRRGKAAALRFLLPR